MFKLGDHVIYRGKRGVITRIHEPERYFDYSVDVGKDVSWWALESEVRPVPALERLAEVAE